MIDPGTYESLGELLTDALVTWKSERALIEVDRAKVTRELRYLDVKREVAKVAAWLAEHGVRAGTHVAIVMSNQSRWLVAATAVLRAGAVLVPIDYKLSADEQAALLAHSESRALVTEAPLFKRFTSPPRIPTLVSEADGLPRDATRWEDLEAPEREPPGAPRRRSDDACIVYSSGTGGAPKGCVLTNAAYLDQLGALMSLFPLRPGHRWLSILPTNHAIDFMCGFLGPFACGAAVVHQRTLRPEFIVSTMRDQRITHTALVPALLAAFERALDEKLDRRPAWQRSAIGALSSLNEALTRRAPDVALSRRLLGGVHDALGGSLELMFSGGAFVDRARAERFYALGLPVVIGYGLTECCTVATVNDLAPFRADGVGRPVRGVEVRIHEPGPDGVGEVRIRGTTVMDRYFRDAELTARTITEDGWLCTGDLGWIDAASHLHLVGRSKNMIVTDGGKNVYPEDVEAAFEGLACEELCVAASSWLWPRVEDLTKESLVAIVRPKKGASAADVARELASRNKKLPEHKRVGALLTWSTAFPRTASLKVKRELLRDAVRAEKSPRDLVHLAAPHGAASPRVEIVR